jgi:hypothetical protein
MLFLSGFRKVFAIVSLLFAACFSTYPLFHSGLTADALPV